MRATKVNAGLAESNGKLLLGIWRDSLHVTCGLTACTPVSAPGPTLGNEYGKSLPFLMPLLVFLFEFYFASSDHSQHIVTLDYCSLYKYPYLLSYFCLQCFDTVGWVAGRASEACKKMSGGVLAWLSCLERGAYLHMAQLMPLPLTVSCFSKIQNGFILLVPAHPGSPGKWAVKRVSK